jgi:hypothetical protein
MPKRPAPLTLLPAVDIPQLQPPIDGDLERADGGIGLRHVEHPLVVHMDRPENTPEGTVFELFWGDRIRSVATTIVREGDEGVTRIPFTVSPDDVHEPWADPVFAKVVRYNGADSETRPLRLRVNLQRPGGRDPDDNTPGHQNLIVDLPEDVLRDGISDVRARIGVEVVCRYWENMAAYDLIILAWGSETVTHRVQPDEVGRDILIVIDYPTILAAGNGEIIPVGFQVMGPTGNYPDEWARWSATQFVDVYMDTNRPDAPRVLFPATEREIDLAQLGGQKVKVEIYISQSDARAYSLVSLIWAGTDSEGNSVPAIETKNLSGYGPYEFEIDNVHVAAIAQGAAVVYYLLQGTGVADKRSNNRHLRIIGEISRWLPPSVDEAPDEQLDPNLPEATVRVPAQSSWPSEALLELVLLAGGPNGTIEHRVGRRVGEISPSPEGDMLFTVYKADLKRFEGYLTDVFYVLSQRDTTPGSIPQESLRLEVQVGELLRDMPAPIVENALGGQLDPDEITDYVKVIAPFPDTKRSDWVNMRWIGPRARSSVMVQVDVDRKTTEHDIGSHFVLNNLHEQVTVYYTLARAGQPLRYSRITTVRIGRGVLELSPPDLQGASITSPGEATLAPLAVQNGTQLVVSYIGMLDSDTIEVTMQGTSGAGSPAIPSKPGDAQAQRVEFAIPKAAIAANIGSSNKTVTFNYVVTRDEVPKSSETLTVTVTPIPVGDLPQPLINNIGSGGKLDIGGFGASTWWSIGPYPFQIAHGQLIWLTYSGVDTNNQATTYAPWVGASNGHPAGYGYNPNHDWFRTLKAGSTLSIEVRIAFDRVNNKTLAVPLQTTVYTVEAALTPLNFDTSTASLAGKVYIIQGRPESLPSWPSGTTIQRQATGGYPGYIYTSSQSNIASVNRNSGFVQAIGKGTAVISVTDQRGQTKSYTLAVSGAIQCIAVLRGMFDDVMSELGRIQARLPTMAELREVYAAYGSSWPLDKSYYWSSESVPGDSKTYYCLVMTDGSQITLDSRSFRASAFGIR